MARTKSTNNTSAANDSVEVKEENQEILVPETKKEEKKEKEIKDDSEVTIICESLAGKKVIGLEGKEFTFDEKGKCLVDGKNAKRFLTIPGYSR